MSWSYPHMKNRPFWISVAVCGNTVVGYTSREKSDIPFVEKHIQSILRQNGYYVNVKIFRKLPDYLNRLDSLWEHRESLEKDIRFTPDETYPDLTRNEPDSAYDLCNFPLGGVHERTDSQSRGERDSVLTNILQNI